MVDVKEIIQEAVQGATPWNVPVIHPHRLCSNLIGQCKEKSSLNCGKCRLDAYCSPECQKQFWPIHKKRCITYTPEPVHQIASSTFDLAYFVDFSSNPPAYSQRLDRENISIIIREKCKEEGLDDLIATLERQWALFKIRSDVYGAVFYPKTVIVVTDSGKADRLLEKLKHADLFTNSLDYEGMSPYLLAKCHGVTPFAERQAILRDFAQVNSKVRIMIVSRIVDSLKFTVPHVETVISIADIAEEGPVDMVSRWQRMARMAGQKGTYMQLASDKLQPAFNKYDAGNTLKNTWNSDGCFRAQAARLFNSRATSQSQRGIEFFQIRMEMEQLLLSVSEYS
ncbi:hypothetical protein F5Y16DRAFT_402413 [Xylariaceae sp. FL0255]|nr:hypothetical protein F5Y16DRAFT_402413 [Xylariaceae sp. FL0255]